jgi:hypothetical protein
VQFVTALALAVALFVAAPYIAHRLRRRRADERDFAAARLVPPVPPKARRRARLEDKPLFVTRALAIVALALLGASPLVRCARLALQRSGGASVALAIVVDDSMSMRADTGGRSRFRRAIAGARELLASARDGDAIAIVLAGAPPRVALAATTDIGAAQSALDKLVESDRATDLDGAIAMARALIAQLPQIDRRIVVLSDLADGNPEGKPVGEGVDVPVWIPMAELRAPAQDCGLLEAERTGPRVRAKVACSQGASAQGREIQILEGDRVVARAPAPGGSGGEVTVTLPADEPTDFVAKLSGSDAIAADDVAPVIVEAGPGSVAVIAESADEQVATGGAPIVEQALAALHLDVTVRPIPAVPDRVEDLVSFAGVIVDDPPGLTPEQRKALGAFVQGGGVALVAVGPRAAAAPLGATLEPLLAHAVTWGPSPVTGAAANGASASFGESAASLSDLAPRGRATLAPEDASALEPLLAWKDGAPLVAKRALGRGEGWLATLPFAVDASDFTLRPGFLALLDAWVSEARARAAPRRGDVGSAWAFPGATSVTVEGPGGAVTVTREASLLRAVPPLIGAYRLAIDGRKELRVATPLAKELDLRPRAAAPSATSSEVGERRAAVDISWAVALALLLLLATELALRVMARSRPEAV